MPHLTQHHRASLDYVLHNTTTRSCAPPVSILLLGPFISTMVIEVAMTKEQRQGSLIYIQFFLPFLPIFFVHVH